MTDPIWENKEVSLYMSTPVTSGQRLFGFSHRQKGQLFAIDITTGRTLWTSEGRLADNAALVRTGDVLWALTSQAELLLFRDSDKQFEPLARYKVGDTPTWAHPVVSTSSVIVKDETKLIKWKLQVPAGPSAAGPGRRPVERRTRLTHRASGPSRARCSRPWQAAASVNNGASGRGNSSPVPASGPTRMSAGQLSHRSEKRHMALASARHILVDDKKQCEEIKKRLAAGGDFAALAAEHSLCPSGQEGGGAGRVFARPDGSRIRPGRLQSAGWRGAGPRPHAVRLAPGRGDRPPGITRSFAVPQRIHAMSETPPVRRGAPAEATERAVAKSETPVSAPPGGDRPAAARRRHVPPWPVWLAVALMMICIVLLRGFADFDSAARNIAVNVLGLITALTLLIWFVCRSAYARPLRFGLLAAVVAMVAVGAAALRIEEFDASLVPTFRLRWQAVADRLLPPAQPATSQSPAPADLSTTTEHDFPQFLGPNRDATISGVELARDWQAHPPQPLWRQPIGAGWSAFALVGPYAVTLEQRGPDELVTCYRIATGELVWAQSTATRHESTLGGVGPRSTPTVFEGKVYTLGGTGRLHCLDGATGRVLWEKDLLEEFGIASPEADRDNVAWGRAGSPLIVGDLVVVPAGGPGAGPFVSLVAYDRQTGREAWRGGDTQISYSSPSLFTLGGVPTIVIVNESNITGHDPKTGAVLWKEDWPGSSTSSASTSQTVALDDHRLLVSKGYSGGSKVFEVLADADSEPRAWHTADLWTMPRNLQTKLTNVVRHAGSIYGLSEGILECVDEETGARRWKKGRFGHGQILLVGDTILVLSETGELTLVAANPARFEELARIQALEGKCWNNPALSAPFLLIRNGQEAACYRLPLAGEPADDGKTADSP